MASDTLDLTEVSARRMADPIRALRQTVAVVPVVPRWQDVDQIFVDLRCSDPEYDLEAAASLAFSAASKAPQTFVIDRKTRAGKLLSVRVTKDHAGGMALESFTASPPNPIRPDINGHRMIAATPHAGIDGTDRPEHDAQSARRALETSCVEVSRTSYRWRARFLFRNGMMQTTQWADADTDTLGIKLP